MSQTNARTWGPMRWPNRREWADATLSVALTFAMTVFPSLMAYIVFKFLGQDLRFEDYCAQGELALYSVSLVTSAIYLVGKMNHAGNMRPLLLVIGVLIMLCATVCFVMAFMAHRIHPTPTPDIQWLARWSVWLLSFSAPLLLVTTALNSVPPSWDPHALEEQEVDDLARDIQSLEESK